MKRRKKKIAENWPGLSILNLLVTEIFVVFLSKKRKNRHAIARRSQHAITIPLLFLLLFFFFVISPFLSFSFFLLLLFFFFCETLQRFAGTERSRALERSHHKVKRNHCFFIFPFCPGTDTSS